MNKNQEIQHTKKKEQTSISLAHNYKASAITREIQATVPPKQYLQKRQKEPKKKKN